MYVRQIVEDRRQMNVWIDDYSYLVGHGMGQSINNQWSTTRLAVIKFSLS